MPRDGSNVYTQPFPDVVDGTTIESAVYNGFTTDVAADLNWPRPIVAGGTGASSADAALVNLGGEKAKQVVTNYDSHAFVPGSFYSAASTTAAPNTHAFAGICYATNGTGDLRLEARDAADDKLYLRVKTGAAWAAWVAEDTISDARYVNLTGDTMTGALALIAGNPAGALDATHKTYVDNQDTSIVTQVNAKVAKTGDTMSGDLVVSGSTGITAGASGGTSGFWVSPSPIFFGLSKDTTPANYLRWDASSYFRYDSAVGSLYYYRANTLMVSWLNDFTFIHAGAAKKPGGGAWVDSSDARIKNELGEYTRGLNEIAQLRPIFYTFKGNDTADPPQHVKSGIEEQDAKADEPLVVPYPNSAHKLAAENGTKYTGLIAQEVEAVIPEMVTQREGYIDGEAVSDLRDLDTTPLIFALINSVKELKARIEALEAG